MKQHARQIGILILALSLFAIALLVPSCTVPQVTTHPDGSASTNYVVDPRLEAAIATGRAANTASAPVKPYSPFIELGLLGATGIAGWVAKRKNDKAAANEQLLKVVTQAVNQLAQEAPDAEQKAKATIQQHAIKSGVEGQLNTFVKKVESGAV